MPRGYEAVLWVMRDGKPKQTGGMQNSHLDSVTQFAFAVSLYMIERATETGYVSVTDISNGKELVRIDFKEAPAASAAAAAS